MREISFLLSGFAGMMPVFFTVLLVFLVTYIVLRWRALKDEDPDPQMGIKAAINFLQFILLIVALLGFSLIFTALFAKIGKSGGKDLWKWGLGMLWGSAVLFAGFEVFYRMFTNHEEYPEVRRAFLGLSLVVVGLIGTFAFVLFWMGLFDKWKGLSFNFPFGLWLIFVPATGGGLILFQKMFAPRATPAGFPSAGGMPTGGGGGVEAPVEPAPQPEAQPVAQEAPAPQPGYDQPAQQPGYDQPAQQPGYGQPGYGQQAPGYPSGGTPAPSPGLPGPGGGPGLPPPGGGYGGGSGGFGQ